MITWPTDITDFFAFIYSSQFLTFSIFANVFYYKERWNKCHLKQYFNDILHRLLRYLK